AQRRRPKLEKMRTLGRGICLADGRGMKMRRNAGGVSRLDFRAVVWAVVVGILTVGVGALTREARAEGEWQSPESVRGAARDALVAALGGRGNAVVEAVGVDDRLRLPKCSAPLAAALERDLRGGQGVVAVSCAEPGWRLFVPVRAVEQ